MQPGSRANLNLFALSFAHLGEGIAEPLERDSLSEQRCGV
jgi:hypothetical protein